MSFSSGPKSLESAFQTAVIRSAAARGSSFKGCKVQKIAVLAFASGCEATYRPATTAGGMSPLRSSNLNSAGAPDCLRPLSLPPLKHQKIGWNHHACTGAVGPGGKRRKKMFGRLRERRPSPRAQMKILRADGHAIAGIVRRTKSIWSPRGHASRRASTRSQKEGARCLANPAGIPPAGQRVWRHGRPIQP